MLLLLLLLPGCTTVTVVRAASVAGGCCGQRQSLNALQLRNFRASTDTFAVFYVVYQRIISLLGQLYHRDRCCTLTECAESLTPTLLLLVSCESSKPGSFTGDPICPQRFLERKCILDHPRIRRGNAFGRICLCSVCL